MKYGLLFLFAAIIGTKVPAVDFSYSAVTTPYKWSTSGNWSSGGFPGPNDSVSISQPLFLQTPLHVDQNVTVSNLFLDVGTLYVDEGKSLTAKKNNSGVVNLGQKRRRSCRFDQQRCDYDIYIRSRNLQPTERDFGSSRQFRFDNHRQPSAHGRCGNAERILQP